MEAKSYTLAMKAFVVTSEEPPPGSGRRSIKWLGLTVGEIAIHVQPAKGPFDWIDFAVLVAIEF